MIEFPPELVNGFITAWFYPFVRIMALLSTAPMFDARMINRRVRVGLAGFMAYLLSVSGATPVPADAPMFICVLEQVLVGASLGFFIRMVFQALILAGDFIGLQMGLGFAMVVDPQNNSQTPLIGSFFNILATLVFLSINGHLLTMDALIQSFKAVPIGSGLGFINPYNIVASASQLFAIGLQLALPVVSCVLAINLAMGLLSKASPQMNIISVGFSVTILAGFVVLWLAVPYFAQFFETAYTQMFSTPIWTRIQ